MPKINLGDIVANSMDELLNSEEYSKLFSYAVKKCCPCKNKCDSKCPCKDDDGKCKKGCSACAMKKKAGELCCSCPDSKCGDDCSCKGNCVEECKCHDKHGDCMDCASCCVTATEELKSIVSDLIRISEVQDKFGLQKSAALTIKAVDALIHEMSSIKPEDHNNVTYDELIENLKDDTDTRRDWSSFSKEYPDVLEHLKSRVNKSHAPDMVSTEGTSQDEIEKLLSSVPPEEEEESFEDEETPDPEIPFPKTKSLSDLKDLKDIVEESEMRSLPTIKPPKYAFENFDEWLKGINV